MCFTNNISVRIITAYQIMCRFTVTIVLHCTKQSLRLEVSHKQKLYTGTGCKYILYFLYKNYIGYLDYGFIATSDPQKNVIDKNIGIMIF